MRAFVALVALCPACGDSSPVAVDAGPTVPDSRIIDDGPCWPDIAHTPRGSANVGTGEAEFEAMPQTLPIHYGAQDGFHVYVSAQMSGFPPGGPVDSWNRGNLRTRFAAYFDDTNVRLNTISEFCPARLGYVPTSGGEFEYELVHGTTYIFDTCWRSDHLTGARLRIEVEILDGDGGYTKDSKVVLGGEPDFIPAGDTGHPGCPQANGRTMTSNTAAW